MVLPEVRREVRRRRVVDLDEGREIDMYKCISCKKVIEEINEKVRCPFCGFRIYAKVRPDTVRRVVAR